MRESIEKRAYSGRQYGAVEDYMTGNISKEALKTLHFEGSEKL